jgi:hypothetical protein
MSDDYVCNIEDCEYSGSPTGLRSHVGGTQDDAHRTARETRAYREWYPEVDWSINPPQPPTQEGDEGSVEQGDESPRSDPDDDPAEPTDGGGNEGDYVAQYEGDADGGSTSTDSGDGGDTPVGWGSIVAGTAVVAAAYLLSRSGDDGGTTAGTTSSDEGPTPDDGDNTASEGVGLIE